MSGSHYILIFWWMLYYVLHSVFASLTVKQFVEKNWNKSSRYYRLSYSIMATIGLVLILIYQYSFPSPSLHHSVIVQYAAFFLLVLPGAIIMFISLKKYFFLLSGIRSIYRRVPPKELKVEGIHRWVRHPLYSGTILWVWGLFFIFPILSNFIAVVLLTLYVIIGIGFEEKKLIKEFGEKYERYIAEVPMLIPGLKIKK